MLKNLSISEFKANQSVESIEIVRNPNTQMLFASTSNGDTFRVQGTGAKHGELDVSKTIEFLYEDDKDAKNSKGEPSGGIENGCFVNKRQDNVLATL